MKGPKALISSAIAEALAEYFVVDVNLIESNLLTDTKIALHNVQLKPITSTVTPENTYGNSTKIHVTGVVEQVVFSWSWSITGSGKSWVKDAVLTISGTKFKAELLQEAKVQTLEEKDKTSKSNLDTSLGNLNQEADEEVVKSIQQSGTFRQYLMNQVQMVVDALTLEIVDFEMTLEMPCPHVEAHDDGKSQNEDYMIAVVVGGKKLTVKSFGRSFDLDDQSTLKQEAELCSFHMTVIEIYGHGNDKDEKGLSRTRVETYSLMDPFSYGLHVVRTNGQRFSSIARGVVLKGGQDLAGIQDEGISFHVARPQLEAFGQLSGLILAPPEKHTNQHSTESRQTQTVEDDLDPKVDDHGDISTFEFTLGSAVLEMMGDSISLKKVALRYKADGTDLTARADAFAFTSPNGQGAVNLTEIVASMRPQVQVRIKSIDTLSIPQTIELIKPMEDIRIDLIGETWTVDIDSFYGSLPAPPTEEILANYKENRRASNLESESSTESPPSGNAIVWVAPFPLACKINTVHVTKEKNQRTEIALSKLEILAYPEKDRSGTRLAVSVASMTNAIASATKMDAYMLIPANVSCKTFRDFAFAAESVSVSAGYSVQDWINTFRIGGIFHKQDKVETSYNLPFAQVAPMKIKIAYDALSVISLKETTFRIKEFKGKKDTKLPDLVDFYVTQCLSRASNFFKNAEVLGLNVESAASFGLFTTISWATPFAPFVGLAAVIGVDSVRGAIDAGKRERKAQEGERGNLSDFFRGIGYSAVEATEKGKLRRGAEDGRGNVLDWMVGTTQNTTEYIGENKGKLGSAGGGATGVIIGTLVGGPVGGVIGGIVGGVTAGTTIRQIDKHVKKRQAKRHEMHEEKLNEHKLLPGQLSLDGTST